MNLDQGCRLVFFYASPAHKESFEVMSAAVTNKVPSIKSNSLFLMSEGLNTCQKNLFNAGDDYVDLVMNYVGAQDEALTARRSKP